MKSKIVNESNWKNYLIKSEQFFETAQEAFDSGQWNSVGLTAVHAAISANDAITVFILKKRSASEKHSAAVDLLLECLKSDAESKTYSKHLLWLIGRKNLIEYEARLFYKKEAEDALKHAERFIDWVKTKLP